MKSSTKTVIVGNVAFVSLAEPERRNALSPELAESLYGELTRLATDGNVRVVVLSGEGQGFCAGADLKRMRTATFTEDAAEYGRIVAIAKLLWHYPKPTIAAIHGFALGAGIGLMLWCDIAIVEDDVRFSIPEVNLGIPAATTVPTLERIIGRRKTLDMILTGRTLSALEAEQFGLVSRVTSKGNVMAAVREIASDIAKAQPKAIERTKLVMSTTQGMPFEASLEYAKDARVLARFSPDFNVTAAQGRETTGSS